MQVITYLFTARQILTQSPANNLTLLFDTRLRSSMPTAHSRHTAIHIHSGRAALRDLGLQSDGVDTVRMETLVDGFRHGIVVRVVGQGDVNGC